MVTGGWITQADRSRWQQRAAAELAAILAAHPGIPVIAWTVTASGGALSGQVLAPAAGRRGLFGAMAAGAGAGRGHRDPVRRRGGCLPARPRCPRRRRGQRRRDRLRRRGGQPVSGPDAAGWPAGSHRAPRPAGKADGRGAPGVPGRRAGLRPARPGVRRAALPVGGCGRPAGSRGLCLGHHAPVAAAGRPDLDEFAATTEPRLARVTRRCPCRVPGCGYGVGRPRTVHPSRQPGAARDARTWLPGWLGAPVPPGRPPAACLDRRLRPVGPAARPCSAAATTPPGTARPARPDEFAAGPARTLVPGQERIDLRQLPAAAEAGSAVRAAAPRRRAGQGPAVHRDDHGLRLSWPPAGVPPCWTGTEQEWRDASREEAGNAVALLAWSPPARSPTWPRAAAGTPSIPATPGSCTASASQGTAPSGLRRDPPALAEGPGQAMDPVAAEHRPRPGSRRPSGRCASYPVRRLPPCPRRRRRGRHQPGRPRALPRRPACRDGRQAASTATHVSALTGCSSPRSASTAGTPACRRTR